MDDDRRSTLDQERQRTRETWAQLAEELGGKTDREGVRKLQGDQKSRQKLLPQDRQRELGSLQRRIAEAQSGS